MRQFLAAIPFVCISLLAPEQGGGGGSSSSQPPAPPAWAPSDTAPEIEGESFEKKVDSAKGIIGSLFGKLKDAFNAFKTLQGDHTTLNTQFDALKETAQLEKEEHGKTKGLLETEKSEHTKTKGLLETTNKNVERLETLCELKGIDKNEVVKPASSAAGGDVTAEYKDLKAKEDKGEVPRGTASKFYNKHKKEIDK